MANTVVHGRGYITLTLDSDFVWSTATITAGAFMGSKLTDLYPEGIDIWEILCVASAVNDVFQARDGSLTGQDLMPPLKCVTGDALSVPYTGNIFYRPYVEYGDLTLGTPANARMQFKFHNQPK
jgi:hypothetical protein